MSILKKATFLKLISWIGVGIMAFGAIISFSTSWTIVTDPGRIGVDFGHMFAILFGILGLVFMLAGGLISRPRYFWLGSIIVGSFYIISFFEFYQSWPGRIHDNQIGILLSELGMSVLPGLVAIIEGAWLKRIGGKKIIKPQLVKNS